MAWSPLLELPSTLRNFSRSPFSFHRWRSYESRTLHYALEAKAMHAIYFSLLVMLLDNGSEFTTQPSTLPLIADRGWSQIAAAGVSHRRGCNAGSSSQKLPEITELLPHCFHRSSSSIPYFSTVAAIGGQWGSMLTLLEVEPLPSAGGCWIAVRWSLRH